MTKTANTTEAESPPAKTMAPTLERPAQGGSYVRRADGTLKRKD